MALTLTDSLALLAFNPDKGHYYDHAGSALAHGLGATLVLDLQDAGAVELTSDDARKVAVVGEAPDDPMLAEAFAAIAGAGHPKRLADWVVRPTHLVKHLIHTVYDHLAAQGVLVAEGKSAVLRRDQYTVADEAPGRDLVAGLVAVLDGSAQPDEGRLVLLGLLPECRLIGDVFPDRDRHETAKRIKALLHDDPEAADSALQVARAVAAQTAAVVAGAVAATAAVST